VSLLSLFGLPPLAGFVGKLEVFKAAIDADQAWLAVVAIVNSVISLYYYLRVLAPTVLDRPVAGSRPAGRGRTPALSIGLGVSAVATALFGVAAEPLLDLAQRATMLGA
jgi:NADH-quinone oxidoreductase subunit N